jgi:GNAT superfamily N-acetyltransferase
MPATSVSISSYPPLNVQVHTPRLSLLGATDELLERLLPVVRKGVVTVARGPSMTFRTVETFSWLGPDVRGRGLGKEMRQAALQLAFEGLGARQADSGAFLDNHASNRVSRALGYQPNGVDWSTRRGDAAEINRWRLTRDTWSTGRRDDIELVGVAECLPVLGIRDLRDC